jgi:HSP20 family protein
MKSLIPWRRRDFPMLEPFRREMETMFHRFFEPLEETAAVVQPWAPRVDVEETEKEIVVKADLPGVDSKGVEISVFDGSLVVKGEKKEAKEEKKKNYHRLERFVGQFYREIPLPTGRSQQDRRQERPGRRYSDDSQEAGSPAQEGHYQAGRLKACLSQPPAVDALPGNEGSAWTTAPGAWQRAGDRPAKERRAGREPGAALRQA